MELGIPMAVNAARRAKVPVAVILDHGKCLEEIVKAIHLGASSVMFDGSHLPYQENVSQTREVVRAAHELGVCVEAGPAMVSTGTAEVVEVAMDTPALDAKLRKGNISVYRHVVPGLYLAMTLNHSGGLLLRWFRDTVCQWELEQARVSGQDAYELILADAPQGPTGLLVLPHFSGSGTPWLDTTSKGAIGRSRGPDLRTTHQPGRLEGGRRRDHRIARGGRW